MKKIFFMSVAAFAMAFASCGGNKDQKPAEAPAEAEATEVVEAVAEEVAAPEVNPVVADLNAALQAITEAIPAANTPELQQGVQESIAALSAKFKEVEAQLSAEEAEVFKAAFNAAVEAFEANLK